MLAKKLGAEFLGTFLLVLGGCGSAIFAAKALGTAKNEVGVGGVTLDAAGIVNNGTFNASQMIVLVRSVNGTNSVAPGAAPPSVTGARSKHAPPATSFQAMVNGSNQPPRNQA